MSQGSRHQDRVFISSLKERQVVTQLLTEDITVEEFLNSPELRSDNINLIKVLVREVSGRYRGELPAEYQKFILNVCKGSSARALFQCTRQGKDVLQNLKEFCLQHLEILDIRNQDIVG